MNINLDDKLVSELDSIFENKRNSQSEWDACIEDIVEEFIARQNGTYDELYCEEEADEEADDVYFDLRGISSNINNGKNGHLTKPPFKKDNLQNRLNDK
jgi:hypothetical protein